MGLGARGTAAQPSGRAPTIAARDDVRALPASAPRRRALPVLARPRQRPPADALHAVRARRPARGVDPGGARSGAGGRLRTRRPACRV